MDTMNKCFVAVMGDNLVIGRIPHPLAKEDALNLAAWLVALAAEDVDRDFTPLLKAVLNT